MFINEKIIKDELYLCKEKEKKLEKEIRHFEKELRRLEKQDAEWIERNIELLKPELPAHQSVPHTQSCRPQRPPYVHPSSKADIHV